MKPGEPASQPGPAEPPSAVPRRGSLRLVGLFVIVASALTRVCVASDPFPYWDSDPTILDAPLTSIGPSFSLALDIVTLLGAAVALLGVHDYRRRTAWMTFLALVAGAAAVFYHAIIRAGGSLDDLRTGSTWLAAFVTGCVACELGREERLRRLAVGAAFGMIALLAAKGLGQVFVEHPQTVEMFTQNRDQFFAAQGWTPESAAARAFERRLMQPEATGWFGLSNVYASVAACTTVGLLGLGACSWALRSRADTDSPDQQGEHWVLPTLGLGAVLALAGLYLAGSKGGLVAAAIGIVVLVILLLASRTAAFKLTPRVASLGAVSVVGFSLCAVVVRGLIGERLGELSLLFRWYYMQGASYIFRSHLLVGVGPAGFKDAYMLAKPVLSPEEVTSPHSLLLDLASTLGLGGLALGTLWLSWVWRLGPTLAGGSRFCRPGDPPGEPTWPLRAEIRVLFLIACIPALVGAMVEAQSATVEGSLVRAAGLAGWTAVSGAIVAALRSRPALVAVLAAGALALAAHAQVEVTPITAGAACWFMLVFGVLCTRPPELPAPPAPPRPPVSPVLLAAPPAALVLAAVVLAFAGLAPTWRWESSLKAGAQATRLAAGFGERLAILGDQRSAPTSTGVERRQLAHDLAAALGRPVADTPEALERAVADLQIAGADRALGHLTGALRSWPTHAETLRAASKLSLQIADTLMAHDQAARARDYADRAEGFAVDAAVVPRGAAASNAWLGTVRAARAASFEDKRALERAVLAWESAAGLDPRGIGAPIQLAEALDRLGRIDEARHWAARALELDGYLRLDPLKGLTDGQRARLVRLAR